jgi:rSAM/selenodomain-associated transferase 1
MKKRLIIFIKTPSLGKVKTRLAATEGEVEALSIYEQLLAYTNEISLKFTQETEIPVHVYFSDVKGNEHLFPNAANRFVQVSGDLGVKMQSAFEDGIEWGFEQQVIIGSDCAEINEIDLKQAFTALNFCDVVLGPAFDGGYYLLGLSKMVEMIFANKPWSTPQLFALTQSEIVKNGYGLFLLATKSDVDTIGDWNRKENLIHNIH